MMTKKQQLRLKQRMAEEKPTVWIGKNGITEEVVDEVKKQLKSNEIVKIRILKTAFAQKSMKAVTNKLLDRTEAELLDARGYTIILYKVKPKTAV
jgi:RNA-binding protein